VDEPRLLPVDGLQQASCFLYQPSPASRQPSDGSVVTGVLPDG
jgi:hypothetical protein